MLIDWFTIVAQIVNFIILVWLLKHFLYRPILHAIDEREKQIAKKISNADKIQLDVKKQSEELKNKLMEFDDQQANLLDKARDEAKAERERLLAEARKEMVILDEKRQEDLKREQKQLLQTIIHRTQKEVFAIARKTLIDLAGISLESQLVDVFIQRLRGLSEEKKKLMKSTYSTAAHQGMVRSSFELSSEQRAVIKKAMEELLNKEIQFKFEVVANLLSGIELIINGQKLAWSINDYLSSMEEGLANLSDLKV